MSGAGRAPSSSSLFTLQSTMKSAPSPPPAAAPNEVKSLVDRALKAWTEEFQLKLRDQAVVTRANYLVQVLRSAERLKQVQQDAAAKLCYEDYLLHAAHAPATDESDPAAAPAPLTGELLANHVQVLYGLNECSFRLSVADDPLLKEPSSVSRALDILRSMQAAMGLLFNDRGDESLSYLVYNGCIVLWRMVEPLLLFGYRRECVEFLSFILLSLESAAVLCGARYLAFRSQVYIAVAQVHEWFGEHATALDVCKRALAKVREVATWESVAQPVPARTLFLLTQAAQVVSVHLLKYAYLLNQLTDAEVEERLTRDFAADTQSIVALLELLRDPHARTADKLVAEATAHRAQRAEQARIEETRRHTEDEAILASSAESAAHAASGTGAGAAKKPKGRSPADILAEVAAATSVGGEKTDRSGASGGGGVTSRVGSAKKKKKPEEEAAEAALLLAQQAALPADLRDPRARFLVELALAKLQQALAQPTPLSVIDARALGMHVTRDLISGATGRDGSDGTADVQHDLPGDWVPSRLVFSVARAAFTHACWSEFRTAAELFASHIDSSPCQAAQIHRDETDSTGEGMRAQIALMTSALDLKEAHHSAAAGAPGVDVARVRELVQIIDACTPAPASSAVAADATALAATCPIASAPRFAGSSLALAKSTDLFSDVCSYLWRSYLEPMLASRRDLRDLPPQIAPPAATEADQLRLAEEATRGVVRPFTPDHTVTLTAGLTALGRALRALRIVDLQWLSHITLELVHLLREPDPTPAVGPLPAEALRAIVRALQPTVAAVEARLGEVQIAQGMGAVGGTLHSIRAHFATHVRRVTGDGDAVTAVETSRKPLASPLPVSDSTLACIYSDLLLSLVDAQLALGLHKAVSAARATHARAVAALEKQYALTATYRRKSPPLLLPTFSGSAESAALDAAGANPYKRAIALLAMLPYRPSRAGQLEFVEKRLRPAMDDIDAHESSLLAYSQLRIENDVENVGGVAFALTADFDSPYATACRTGEDTRAAIEAAVKRASKGKLPPPRLIARSLDAIVLRPVVPIAYRRKWGVRGVALYGKASETGVDVSSHNTEYVPLGVEYLLPPIDSDEPITDIVVRGLAPNTSYVFACQCFDATGAPVGLIGTSSPRLVTCVPVARAAIDAAIVATLRRVGDIALRVEAAENETQRASGEAEAGKAEEEEKTDDGASAADAPNGVAHAFYFSAQIKSSAWSILAPFVRIRAVSSHARGGPGRALLRGATPGGAAATLGAGDRLDFDTIFEPDVYDAAADDSTACALSSIANRRDTTGVRDSFTLGPATIDSELRLDVWQLHIGLLQAAPRPLLYALATAAHAHADCLATRSAVGAPSTRPLSVAQLAALEVVRSLRLALQFAAALEDWRAVLATALKMHDAIMTTLGEDGIAPLADSPLVTQPLLAIFHAIALARARVPHEAVTGAVQRATARVVFALARSLSARGEHAIVARVLDQYATMTSVAHAHAATQLSRATLAYRARLASIDVAKSRAAAMREALDVEAAEARARREKELSKKKGGASGPGSATKRSRKPSNGAIAAAAIDDDAEPTSPTATSRSNIAGDDHKDDGDAGVDPAYLAVLAHPLLTASAGHCPAAVDYFLARTEETALANYLLAHPRTFARGDRIAAALLGRRPDSDALVAAGAVQAQAPAQTQAAPAADEKKKERRRDREPAAPTDEPPRARDDIDACMCESLHRAAASRAFAEVFATLQSDFGSHARFLEYASRIARAAIDAGELAVAKQILITVDDPELTDPRLRTDAEEADAQAKEAAAVAAVAAAAASASDPAASSRPNSGLDDAPVSSRPRGDSDASRPGTSASKAASSSTAPRRGKRDARAEEAAAAAAAAAQPLPRYTRDQLLWLSEVELLRSIVLSIDLECARAAERLADPARVVELSAHTALGWEFDVARASKLRPSCMGVQGPSSGNGPRTARSSMEDVSGSPRTKFPPLATAALSPRSPTGALSARSKGALTGRGSASGALALSSPRSGGALTKRSRLGDDSDAAGEATVDPLQLEFSQWHRLARAAWFAARARAWAQLLALATRHAVNMIQAAGALGRKDTPADLALRVFLAPPHIAAGMVKTSAATAAEEEQATASNVSTLPSSAWESDTDARQFATPVSCLLVLAGKVLDGLDALRLGEELYDGAPRVASDRALQMQLFADAPGVRASLMPQVSHEWWSSKSGLPVIGVTRILTLAVRTLFHALRWPDVLLIGRRAHHVLGDALVAEDAKYLIYAQEETRHRARSALDMKQTQIADLTRDAEADARAIIARRDLRRSQRGKREEDERLQLLQQMVDAQRRPLEDELAKLGQHFAYEDRALEELRARTAHITSDEPSYARALLNARCKLLAYYNDAARGVIGLGGGLDDLAIVSESRAASRPVSRGGSVLESDADGAAPATESDDVRSLLSLSSSLGSTAFGGGAGGVSSSNLRRLRRTREKTIALVVRSYQKAIAAVRADAGKDAAGVLGRALHELADFVYVEYGANAQPTKRDDAFTYWHECLDATFGTLESSKQRAVLLRPYSTPSGSVSPADSLLSKVGFWPAINGLLSAAKLGRLAFFADINMRREMVLFAGALARTLFHSSLTHPARDAEFGRYQCESLWPGGEDLFADPTRARVGPLLDALEFTTRELLRSREFIRALPVVTLYEYVARVVACSVFHTANARVIKARACLAAGQLTEASLIYIQLLEGLDLPRASVTGLALSAHPAAMTNSSNSATAAAATNDKKASKRKDKEAAAATGGAAEKASDAAATSAEDRPNIPPFNSHFAPHHSSNRGFVLYLLGELSPASHAHSSPQAVLYGGLIWSEIRFLRAAFLSRVGAPRSQLSASLEAPDDGADAYVVRRAATKERRRKSRPNSVGGDRPGSASRDPPTGAGSGQPGAMTPGESLALRISWLRAAERVHAETIALFVPNDPNAKPGDPALPTTPAVPAKRGSRREREESAAGAGSSAASRRRTAQNFADVFMRQTPAATGATSTAASGATLSPSPSSSALDQAASNPNVQNAELLVSLTRGHAVLPVALVARAYDALAELRTLQGLHADAAYFARRALRVMADHPTPDAAALGATSGPAATVPLSSPTSPTSPVRSLSPSLRGRRSPTRDRSGAAAAEKEGSFASLARERQEKMVRDLSAAAPGDGTARIAFVPPVAGPNIGPHGLLSVPIAPGAEPLSWRQLVDPRDWLATRLRLASTLLAQGRLSGASEQLTIAEGEAQRMVDPVAQHAVALVQARLLLQEGKFLDGLSKLRATVWREPTDAEKAKRAAMIAKLPGGEGALPPPVPRAPTYTSDDGEALLACLALLRRLPKKDAPDAIAAKGEMHSAWILRMLETMSLDRQEEYGVRPSDLLLAAETGASASLRKMTTTCASLPHADRSGQNLIDLRLPGVVSLYTPWASTALHAHFLAARDLLRVRGNASEAMKRALIAEHLLALIAYPPPILVAEVHHLIALCAWRKTRDQWSRDGSADLLAGMSDAERASFVVAPAPPIVAATSVVPNTPKKSPTTRNASPSTTARPTSPSVEKAAGGAAETSSGSTKKKRGDASKTAEATAAAAAAAAAAAVEAAEAAAIALRSNPLVDTPWESLAGHLPRPIPNNEPKSLSSIVSRLHTAVQYAVLHGMQQMRVKKFASLLVEVHEECARQADATTTSSARAEGIATSLFESGEFHRIFAAFWRLQATRAVESFAFLRTRALLEIGSTPLPAVTSDPDTFPVPAYLAADLAESLRARQKRRDEEMRVVAATQTDVRLEREREELRLDTGGVGGGKDRKDKDATSTAGGSKERDRRGAAPPVEPDEAVSTRSLLLYADTLRSELNARRFESEVCAAFAPEQAALIDVHQLLSAVPGYEQACLSWSGPIAELGSSEKLAAAYSAIRASVEDACGAPGCVVATWLRRAMDATDGSVTDAAADEQSLTLSLALSNDVHRGLTTDLASPANSGRAAAGKHGKHRAVPSSPTAAARKKKNSTGAGGASSLDQPELTQAQTMFGRDAGAFSSSTVCVTRAAVHQLSVLAASLRHVIVARSAPGATLASLPAQLDLAPTEQLLFVELLLRVQDTFGSHRPVRLDGAAATDDSSRPNPTLINLAAYIDYFARECGLVLSIGELIALESLLDASSDHGGAALAHANGICLFLHEMSLDSLRRLDAARQPQTHTQTTTTTAPAAVALVSPPSKHARKLHDAVGSDASSRSSLTSAHSRASSSQRDDASA